MRPCNNCGTPVNNAETLCEQCGDEDPKGATSPTSQDSRSIAPDETEVPKQSKRSKSGWSLPLEMLLEMTFGVLGVGGMIALMVFLLCYFGFSMTVATSIIAGIAVPVLLSVVFALGGI